jgi:hypothetical protein
MALVLPSWRYLELSSLEIILARNVSATMAAASSLSLPAPGVHMAIRRCRRIIQRKGGRIEEADGEAVTC